jgi:hypothetical protein
MLRCKNNSTACNWYRLETPQQGSIRLGRKTVVVKYLPR